ncbi:MAG: hypothetical protein PVJ64_07930 [Gemmatimonadales bacterium]|jgi:hypothetical protein
MQTTIVLFLALALKSLGAQQVIDLNSFERCRACEVEAVLDLRLGDPDLPGGIESEYAHAVFDEVNGGYAVFRRTGTHVQLFDSLGTFQAVLSREGGGPGELRGLTAVAFADGNIVMLDFGGPKFVVMSRDGELIADSRIDLQTGDFRVISADTVVIGSMDRRPNLVGYPLHLVSLSDGEVLRNFGSLKGEWNAAEPFARLIILGEPAGDRSVWRGYVGRLRLEEWTLDGSLNRVVTGDFDWFPPMVHNQEGPPSSLRAFAMGRDRRLWLLTRVPDPNWRRVHPGRLGPETLIRREDADRYWDTRLDMFDLRTEQHLGTVRWDGTKVFLASRRGTVLVNMVEYDAEMVPRVALYRLDIKASP